MRAVFPVEVSGGDGDRQDQGADQDVQAPAARLPVLLFRPAVRPLAVGLRPIPLALGLFADSFALRLALPGRVRLRRRPLAFWPGRLAERLGRAFARVQGARVPVSSRSRFRVTIVKHGPQASGGRRTRSSSNLRFSVMRVSPRCGLSAARPDDIQRDRRNRLDRLTAKRRAGSHVRSDGGARLTARSQRPMKAARLSGKDAHPSPSERAMADLEPIPYPDAKIRSILERVKTIAMVGASPNWNRPSYFVMKYLQGKGYRVIPVNPAIAGKTLLGETVYAALARHPRPRSTWSTCSAPHRRRPASSPRRSRSAPRCVWMQLGVRNDEAAQTAEAAGIEVIMNRCPKIEFGRLGGELSWSGVNSGIIRNRAPAPPLPRRVKARPAPPRNLDLRLRDPRHPCRRRARPDHRRARDADLSDDGLCVRGRRPRRLALQPAQFRLHLFAADQPDGRGARGADREPRGRARGGRRRPRAMRRNS